MHNLFKNTFKSLRGTLILDLITQKNLANDVTSETAAPSLTNLFKFCKPIPN